MGKIVISENVSLDGVVQDPTGDEGFDRGGWFGRMAEDDRQAWAKLELEEALAAEALLLGRRSDEWFAARWTSRGGEWADRLNAMPKYVVSSTADAPRWGHGTILSGAVVDEVSALKRQIAGDIVVYASIRLVHTLIEHGLVDEFRLTVHPVVLGAGERLVGGTSAAWPLRLVEARTLGSDLTLLVHRPVGDGQGG